MRRPVVEPGLPIHAAWRPFGALAYVQNRRHFEGNSAAEGARGMDKGDEWVEPRRMMCQNWRRAAPGGSLNLDRSRRIAAYVARLGARAGLVREVCGCSTSDGGSS